MEKKNEIFVFTPEVKANIREQSVENALLLGKGIFSFFAIVLLGWLVYAIVPDPFKDLVTLTGIATIIIIPWSFISKMTKIPGLPDIYRQ
jgi:hypothetical protein